MPNASAQGLKRYLRLKGGHKAKEFQKVNVEEWLEKTLKKVPLSDLR